MDMEKHFIAIASIALIALAPFSACKQTPRYPELSASLADSLKQTDIKGVFISGVKSVQPRPAKDVNTFCPRFCATTTVYWVQVTYPITICNPPDFSNDVVLAKRQQQDSAIARVMTAEVSHAVSKSRFADFTRLFCRTHGGPWFAEITDMEMCDNSCGEGTHRFTMTILGVPQQLSWLWWDSMDNHPQEVQFIGQPFVRGTSVIDCNPGDLTDCGAGGNTGGGPIPATQPTKKQ